MKVYHNILQKGSLSSNLLKSSQKQHFWPVVSMQKIIPNYVLNGVSESSENQFEEHKMTAQFLIFCKTRPQKNLFF